MVLKNSLCINKNIYYSWIVSVYSVELIIKGHTYILTTFFKKLKYFSQYRKHLSTVKSNEVVIHATT